MGLALAAPLPPAAGLLACVLAHVAASRLRPAGSRPGALAAGVAVGLVAVAASGFALGIPPGERPGAPLVWLLAYLALAYAYVFGFYNIGESARRIRLLIELAAAGPRGLTRAEILATYNARTIVEARLRRLVTGGQVAERDGRYYLRRSLALLAAKVLVALKVVLLGAPTELGRAERRLDGSPTGARR